MSSFSIMGPEQEAPMPTSLTLAAMPQQRHVRERGEDWTGVTSTAARRKLQNRLNQRAYRQRKIVETRKDRARTTCQNLLTAFSADGSTLDAEGKQIIEQTVTIFSVTNQEGPKMLLTSQHREKVLGFAREAYEHYTLGMPRPNQLHLLIKLNVLNAVARNATLIGMPTDRLCADEAVSPFCRSGPLRLADEASWPKHLRPSAAQISVEHHPWIDMLPFPVMRDRAIRAFQSGVLDEDELCLDLMEVDGDRSETPSLIVWGESSDPFGWEASLPFLEKYGWLVWGCSEIFESTNLWRSRRGEKQLGW
ncbi:hypothetical protein SUNI508_03458 [Seiridium unicorne]|uniref:BZIP domain-containing protein n=1 Tax=Seiridium unicorne TaxID=138068 RepID=A0ABR2VCE0_9PEZI